MERSARSERRQLRESHSAVCEGFEKSIPAMSEQCKGIWIHRPADRRCADRDSTRDFAWLVASWCLLWWSALPWPDVPGARLVRQTQLTKAPSLKLRSHRRVV